MAATSRTVWKAFVSKIPWTVANRDLRVYFEQFGKVKRCILPQNRSTGFHKGFGWVTFSSEQDLNNALQKDPHTLEGATLHVQRSEKAYTIENEEE